VSSAAIAAAAACQLCGLPTGSEERTFCCLGCRNVYTILRESGIVEADFRDSDLYRQSLRLGLIANASLDFPAIPETAEKRDSVYQLSGLWCTSCGWLIEQALRKERGIVNAEVLFAADLLKVTYCPQYIPTGRIEQTVASLGYRASLATGETEPARREQRELLLKLGLAAGLWMNVMLFSLVIYASYFEGIAGWARAAVPVILMALATPAVFYSGRPILWLGWQSLRHGTIRMETLISTGILAAYGYSALQILRHGTHFYFDTACAIVTLVLTGKALEQSAKAKTARALSTLHRMLPKKARVLTGDREYFVSIDAIQPGMTLLVKPGERIPADGVVLEGNSGVDESVITGESKPREKRAADAVVGGSLNGAGVLYVKATRPAAESTLSQIVQAVEKAIASRTEVDRMVDRISRIFVPAVLVFSCLTMFGCMMAGLSEMESLMRAIAVLVIACPCALGIATPLATTAAVGAASRSGILLRHPGALESIRKLDVLILDKTGTATEGRFRVHDSCWLTDGAGLLASLESVSEHPVAQAIVQQTPGPLFPATDVRVHKGSGITGLVNGHQVAAGNRKLIGPVNPELEDRAQFWERSGLTVVFCTIGRVLAGALALGDRLRTDAPDLVHALQETGVKVVLISGDAAQTTERIASQLGITEFRGEVLPDQKIQAVREYQSHGQVVAMVGDGINDAPALAAADLGIAMGSGTDLTMQSAPVVLMGDSLMKIADVIDLARRTNRIIRTNLFWAFSYNVVGISLAITGILNPIMAAGAMVISSLCVIGNSLRLKSPGSGNKPQCPSCNSRNNSCARCRPAATTLPMSRQVHNACHRKSRDRDNTVAIRRSFGCTG
jgi:heavy metal translocating P-type ATPase